MPHLSIGGQAVLEGVMMRSKERLAIAVRRPDGSIVTHCRRWFSLQRQQWLTWPLVRGFPILLETVINGIQALQYSASQALDGEEEELSPRAMAMTIFFALGLAILLFVVTPHLMSLAMQVLRLGGDASSFSFHAWDGLFRFLLFLGYVVAISFLPDVRRVFEYHGAEHKVIHAFESNQHLDPAVIVTQSRLHARCGTAFLLFVLSVSIILYAGLIPVLPTDALFESPILRHVFILLVKLLLLVPISGISYELIKFSSRLQSRFLCSLICLPGLVLQLATTKEPDPAQIEVAVAALRVAIGDSGVCEA